MNEYEHLMQKRASQYVAPIAGGLIGAGLGYMLPSADEEYEYDKYGRRVKKTKPNNMLKAVNVLGGGLMGAGLGMGAHQLWRSLPGTGWKQKMDGVYNKLTGTTPPPSTPETAQPPAPPQEAPVGQNSKATWLRNKIDRTGQRIMSKLTPEQLAVIANQRAAQVNAPAAYRNALDTTMKANIAAGDAGKAVVDALGRRKEQYPGGMRLLPAQLAERQQQAEQAGFVPTETSTPGETFVGINANAAEEPLLTMGTADSTIPEAVSNSPTLGEQDAFIPDGAYTTVGPDMYKARDSKEQHAAIREAGGLPATQVAGIPGLVINAPVDDYRPGVANSYLSNEFVQRAARQMIANGMQGVTKKTAYRAIADALIELYGKQYEDAIWNDVDAAYNANKSNW